MAKKKKIVIEDTEKFIKEQIPDIEICYHQLSDGEYPDWPITLRLYLNCLIDYTDEIKKELNDMDLFRQVVSAMNTVKKQYVYNGDLCGYGEFKIMSINQKELYNRITYKTYQAIKAGFKDNRSKLMELLQSYSSEHCIMLNPREERAVCALYHCTMADHKDKSTKNFAKDAVFETAYTFFCLRLRKVYSTYEKALRASSLTEDGILAVITGFAMTLDEYNFETPQDTGLGPGRLNIPIRTEVKNVLHNASDFAISDATWKKIYSYHPDKHGNMTRKELMEEFHATASTVEMMLLIDEGGMQSLESDVSKPEDDGAVSVADFLGKDDDGYFLIELQEVIDVVLDDDQKEIFECVVFNGMKYKEISELTGMPERKVKYLFELCRRKLKPIYSDTSQKKSKFKKAYV